MSKNKMHKHTRQLEERELLFTELVEITSRAQKHSGNLLYTLGPTQYAAVCGDDAGSVQTPPYRKTQCDGCMPQTQLPIETEICG